MVHSSNATFMCHANIFGSRVVALFSIVRKDLWMLRGCSGAQEETACETQKIV
jgi:hypothetical protein